MLPPRWRRSPPNALLACALGAYLYQGDKYFCAAPDLVCNFRELTLLDSVALLRLNTEF